MGSSGVVMSELRPASAFLGVHCHVVDVKGRVSIPSSFRAQLGDSFVLSNFIRQGVRCLDGYSRQDWGELVSNLKSKGRFNSNVAALETYFFSRAVVCELDSSGRFIIPAFLREYAGIKDEIAIVGALHGFRIWERKVWEMVFSQAEAAVVEDPGIFEGIDLNEKSL